MRREDVQGNRRAILWGWLAIGLGMLCGVLAYAGWMHYVHVFTLR